MPFKSDSILWLFFLLFNGMLAAQSQMMETDTAIRFTYEITPYPETPDPTVSSVLRNYVVVQTREYRMFVFGTFEDHGGYHLTQMRSRRSFHAIPDEIGISFLPMTNMPTQPVQTRYTSNGRVVLSNTQTFSENIFQDTICGWPCKGATRIIGNDTITMWVAAMPGYTIGEEQDTVKILMGSEFKGVASSHANTVVKIDTLLLKRKYYDPAMHQAPVDFNTTEKAFMHAAMLMNADVKNEIEFRRNLLPDRTLMQTIPLDQMVAMKAPFPSLSVRELKTKVRFSTTALQGKTTIGILIDYECIDPVPDFLSNWLAEISSAYPGVQVMIFTRSKKTRMLSSLEKKGNLSSFPHFLLDKTQYEKFNGQEPLTYMIIDHEGRLVYLKSGYDVHGMSEMEEIVRDIEK